MSEDIEKILFKATDLHVHHGRDRSLLDYLVEAPVFQATDMMLAV